MNCFKLSFLAGLLTLLCLPLQAQLWKYVDPRIGSEGVGRTFPGPAMPFGMVKPGPDCGVLPNAGWAPMPEPVSGFSQTHVSGTGGGQKYGNILLQPFLFDATDIYEVNDSQKPQKPQWPHWPQQRLGETISLGYYSTTYEDSIRTEITTNERCAHYRIHFPQSKQGKLSSQFSLLVDATHYLGKDTIPDLRERQQFIDAEVETTSNNEVMGYSRIRGGWNNGDAYTVYFCLQTDKPFGKAYSKGSIVLFFSDTLVNVKVGISYVSTMQARRNIDGHGFDEQLQRLRNAWEEQLQKVHIEGTEQQKCMFYTALYHTMLMPVCKTGENPKWTESPYYDDYYAIWDTYRTSSPLLTLLWPERQVEIINSLLNIYAREGYMPDARSGDCNGRTQGGSNAEVVIADAFVKGLGTTEDTATVLHGSTRNKIDYKLALEAMLKDAEQDPGADHEKHGRGGLNEYRRLGYVPYGIPRAGTRTVEYAYNDYCIAQVAKGLLREECLVLSDSSPSSVGNEEKSLNTKHSALNIIYEEYIQRSRNWRNLWRKDYEWDDVKGYIMPRDENGAWLDSVPWGRSKVFKPRIPYTPVTKVAPWFIPWWDTFFYEALSAEYSLSIPHDVEGLIEACGGKEDFRRRLDLFFERGRYNVGNEPSFLTPCLYHWLGRPDLSTQRIRQIITDNYSDQPDGLPGNDDGGAMSSWLAFHMMGLYPNAGQDYYLLNVPLVDGYTLTLPNGRSLKVSKRLNKKKATDSRRLSRKQNVSAFSVFLNGRELPDARITHMELMQGGELVFQQAQQALPQETQQTHSQETHPQPLPVREGSNYSATDYQQLKYLLPALQGGDGGGSAGSAEPHASLCSVSFTLNRQFRTWPLTMHWMGDTLGIYCKKTLYLIPRSETEKATGFCWLTPQDDGTVYHDVLGTFLFVSDEAMRQLSAQGFFSYDGIVWRLTNSDKLENSYRVRADIDGTEMVIAYDQRLHLWLVTEMRHNPLGIDWIIKNT